MKNNTFNQLYLKISNNGTLIFQPDKKIINYVFKTMFQPINKIIKYVLKIF